MGNHLCSRCCSGEKQGSELSYGVPHAMWDWPYNIKELISSLNQVCKRIEDKANSSSEPVVLHPSKCRCLARSYVVLMNDVLKRMEGADAAILLVPSLSSSSPLWKKLEVSLRALCHAMQEGEKFLVDCTYRGQEKWLVKKAFGLLSSTHIVDTHLHDLVWCIWAINEALKQLQGQDHNYVLEAAFSVHLLLGHIWRSDDRSMEGKDLSSVREVLAKAKKGKGRICTEFAEYLCRRFCDPCVADPEAYLWVDPDGFVRGKESLGKGGFAEIFEVKWMGGRFATKDFFHVEDDTLFGKEAEVQARLRHPNVLQLVCCTKSSSVPNKCSLVTELMDRDLRNLIIQRRKDSRKNTPFPLLAAVDMMLQIAKGMEYLHGLHIMHRDLKSSNILVSQPCPASYLDESGHVKVKIADFGMSKMKQTSSMYTTKDTGTTLWRAPEVFDIGPEEGLEAHAAGGEPKARYTKKADVYSFALVCFEILTGELPFDDHKYKLKKLHKSLMRGERPRLPPSCPLAISSFIEDCWVGDPGRRPTFTQICSQLRYLKACILLDEEERLSRPCSKYIILSAQDPSNKENEYDRVFKIPIGMCLCSKLNPISPGDETGTGPKIEGQGKTAVKFRPWTGTGGRRTGTGSHDCNSSSATSYFTCDQSSLEERVDVG